MSFTIRQSPPQGPSETPGPVIIPTSHADISQTAFYVLNWIFLGLCTLGFAVRAFIRLACFRHLLLEDYLMLLALIVHSAEAALIELFVGYAYDLESAQKGNMSKAAQPGFLDNSKQALVALGVSINLAIIGILLIKVNFLLFFRRLSSRMPWAVVAWWAVLLFTIGGAAAQIGMQEFTCFFGDVEDIFSHRCTSIETIRRVFINAIVSVVLDAVADFLIILFPVTILWSTRLSMRRKLLLTSIFCIVFLTIAITVVRGSVFHDAYDNSGSGKILSATFLWFWFYCEFTVAYLVACIVSFRTLFVQRENRSKDRYEKEQRRKAIYNSAMRRRGWRGRASAWRESILETCKTLEGWSGSEGETLYPNRGLPDPPIGLMTVDFNDDASWTKNIPTTTTILGRGVPRSVSAQSLLEPQPTHPPGSEAPFGS
ncbi:hypothetical protein B0I35DRAFT_474258 [Stachybotrys elegans]|uniref:Rhodopsin domain-containing protein n=1 Tax=Stachybotrys elegans TaxID=80388 RepID=A0A8K0T0X9_9HYPO|nr:hypothetical protein B0I35DRAFT_474258 [Stachybotrys elegans]